MSVTKITYENKEAIQNDASVPNKSKVTDTDMNEIKQVVNNNADEVTGMQENIEDLQDGQGSANADITSLKNRVNTLESNVSNLENNKVDKIEGKSLSTEDFTTELKTKLEGLNNYDDTDIKEEQIQQNKNIENLQTNDSKQDLLISKLKNVALNAKTEEAKSLHIKDANKFGSLEVLGNHEQETREGYSIWDYLSVARSSADGLTIEKDFEEGYITVNGTPNSNYVNLCIQEDITDMLEDGQTYTLWQEKYADSNTKGIYLQVTEKTLSGTTNYFSRDNAVNFTVNKQNATYQIGLQTGTIKDTGALSNYKNRYMIYKGTDTKTYELPGATPSIKYPSEIKCLGSNKQLFDKDNANKINATPSGYVIVASSFGKSFYLEVKPNMDYSISRKIVGKRFVVCTTTQVPAAGVSVTQSIENNSGEEINIKTRENDKYLLVYYLYNNSENEEEILSSIKVEEGKKATSYSPYRTR